MENEERKKKKVEKCALHIWYALHSWYFLFSRLMPTTIIYQPFHKWRDIYEETFLKFFRFNLENLCVCFLC